jgi:hypothetical protein
MYTAGWRSEATRFATGLIKVWRPPPSPVKAE